MAMIDYGAILKIDGKIQNRDEFFMDMQDAVGWVDYPRIRYEDCDCINNDGYSNCGDCPRHQGKHYSDPKLGEWDFFDKDCRGNDIHKFSFDGNYFVYAGDEDFTIGTYKTWAAVINKNDLKLKYMDLGYRYMSKRYEFQTKDQTVNVRVKRIAESNSQLYMTFRYKGKLYEIVYGYGIDSNRKVWDEVKYRYIHNKKMIKFVDKFWEEK